MGSDALLIIDAHVHIYDCYDVTVFLKHAMSNCRRVAHLHGAESSHVPLLFLTEGRNERSFQRLKASADDRRELFGKDGSKYTISRTDEDLSIAVNTDNGVPLFLISGKQLVTYEGLEVLSVGSGWDFSEGRTLKETVDAVIDEGAIPIIPWGFGKWYGKRGRVLEAYLNKCAYSSRVFLGDNGARPSFLPAPIHFAIGRRRGVRVLPGSDPLPFSRESKRPGSFGCTVRGSIRRERPSEDCVRILTDPETIPTRFGSPETPYRFLRNQFAMQLRKIRSGNFS